jgi:hypothetical protein
LITEHCFRSLRDARFAGPVALRLLPGSSRHAAEGSSNLTPAQRIPRREIGPAQENLRRELLDMYWKGVKRELVHILLTLRRYQQNEYAEIVLVDEKDDFIHGFDTFLDQVSHSSRKFANRYNDTLERDPNRLPTYEAALRDRSWNIYAEQESLTVKGDIMVHQSTKMTYKMRNPC